MFPDTKMLSRSSNRHCLSVSPPYIMCSYVILSRLGALFSGSDFIAALSSAKERFHVSKDGIWESSVSSLAVILLMFSSNKFPLNVILKLESLVKLIQDCEVPTPAFSDLVWVFSRVIVELYLRVVSTTFIFLSAVDYFPKTLLVYLNKAVYPFIPLLLNCLNFYCSSLQNLCFVFL